MLALARAVEEFSFACLGLLFLGLTHQTADRELRQCSAVTCFLAEARLPAAIVRAPERAELEESARECFGGHARVSDLVWGGGCSSFVFSLRRWCDSHSS